MAYYFSEMKDHFKRKHKDEEMDKSGDFLIPGLFDAQPEEEGGSQQASSETVKSDSWTENEHTVCL